MVKLAYTMPIIINSVSINQFIYRQYTLKGAIIKTLTWYLASRWIDLRNEGGGRTYPKKDLVKTVQKMDQIFEKYHSKSKDGLLRGKGVIKNLTDLLIKKFPELAKSHLDLLKRFARSRTFFRLRCMQRKLADKRIESLRSKRKKIEFSYSHMR